MIFYYSKSEPGFYCVGIHGDNIPKDAVSITQEEHTALLNAQSKGKWIQSDENGYPVAVDPPPLTPEEWADINLRRRQARLSQAALKVAPLQDAVDLNIATDDEKQLLKEWKLYRVALNRIEQHANLSAEIDWPKPPDEN
ncbi:MAG: virus tail fiber assembly protein, lambda gpK [Glomeribacter sp. 1016415]|nr:virus tail fiber assembly protein, lambda gpK [Glomeribacter sp. 1016415]